MRSLMRLFLFAMVFAGASAPAARAAFITQWTFETSLPTNAGPHAAEFGTGFASRSGGGGFSNPVGNGSNESFSSNAWVFNNYYQFAGFSTAGFTNLQLTFSQTSSGTGPRNFLVQTSLDGTTYTNLPLGSYAVLENGGSPNASWNSSTSVAAYNFTFPSLPGGIVGIRLVNWTNISASGGTVAAGGTSRVDNVFLSGDPVSPVTTTPAPPTLVAFGLSAIVLVGVRRRQNAAATTGA